MTKYIHIGSTLSDREPRPIVAVIDFYRVLPGESHWKENDTADIFWRLQRIAFTHPVTFLSTNNISDINAAIAEVTQVAEVVTREQWQQMLPF